MRVATENPQLANSVTTKQRPTISNRRRYFREYCTNSSIHGLKYLSEERSVCERFLWIILITTSVAACGYLINRIYKKYDQSPVIVSFATKESPIFTIPFPAVTICPMTKMTREKLNYTKIIHKKEDNETCTPEENRSAQYLSLLCEEGIEYFPDNKTFTNDFFDKLDELQPSMMDFFPCEFMGDEIECTEIFKKIILDEGVCYTFNMMDREEIFRDNVVHYSNYHQNRIASKWNIDHGYSSDSKLDTFPMRALLAGADNSIKIMLVELMNDTDHLCVEDVQGYSVALHTPHTIPSPKKQYFQVPFDTSVIAVIQPKMMTTSEEVKKYDPIDRECYFSYERPLHFFKIYTPENCLLECLTNYTLKQCGCVNFYMPRDNNTSICGNGNFGCMKAAERQLKEIELNNVINMEAGEDSEIICDCMPLCTELSYDMEQSHTAWDWQEQLRVLRIPEIEMFTKSMKISKLTVFFKLDQFLTSQRNELYGPTDFLANFGGLLGLFTGFSLLSLAEIVYYCTVRIFCNIRLYKVWTGACE